MAIAREGLPEEIPNARIEANGSNAQTFPSAPIPLSSTIKARKGAGLEASQRHRAQTTSAGQTSTRTAKASRSSTAHSAASTGRASALACAASRKGRRASGRSRVRLCRLGRFSRFDRKTALACRSAQKPVGFKAVKAEIAPAAREVFWHFVSQIASFPNLMTRFTKNSERENERRHHFPAFSQVTRFPQSVRNK